MNTHKLPTYQQVPFWIAIPIAAAVIVKLVAYLS